MTLALPAPPRLLALPAPPFSPGMRVRWRAEACTHFYNRMRLKHRNAGKVGVVKGMHYWPDRPVVLTQWGDRVDNCYIEDLEVVEPGA